MAEQAETRNVHWPDTSLPENQLVLELNALRDGLTSEKAAQLCSQLGCGYLIQFVESRTLHYATAMAAYIQLLISIAKIVDRRTFMEPFPKSCGGCASIQFFCMVNLHRELANDVFDLFRVLLNDDEGEIVTKDEVLTMGTMMRSQYKRHYDPFPYMGNCLDFTEELRMMTDKLRDLITNEKFGLAMQKNRTQCISFLKQYFTERTTLNLNEFLETL
ncbi:unnamed protein product [Rotaria sp. Silwood2]|nr:unnamed protein product [Rotaria sp. Silwood2]CAF4203242.1 unnamed protein product [Rotaria sp. Silwood2]